MRSKRQIDAAMQSDDVRLRLSVTDEELDGVLSAGAMHWTAQLEGHAPLPEVPEWLARKGGISEAAKVLIAIVMSLGPCSTVTLWARIGSSPLGAAEWGRFLAEAESARLALRTPDGRLVVRAMEASR